MHLVANQETGNGSWVRSPPLPPDKDARKLRRQSAGITPGRLWVRNPPSQRTSRTLLVTGMVGRPESKSCVSRPLCLVSRYGPAPPL